MNFNLDAFRQNEEEFNQQFNRALNESSSDDEEPPKYDADLIINEQNDEMMRTITNFKCQQFSVLFRHV